MIKKFKLFKEEEGIGLVWVALSFAIIIFMAGLAIDGGRLYLSKIELRKTADAAALSGASELTGIDSSITNVVNQTLTANNELSSLKQLIIRPNNENKITVSLEKQVPLYFMKIFGFNNIPVDVSSTAAIFSMSQTTGAVPFGISSDTIIDFMSEYALKVDAGSSSTGNFGILALSGVGASLYGDALKYGYDQKITSGEIIYTQTGNIQQKTVDGVNYRINNSPYAAGDTTHPDDPRIIKVLVYDPYSITTNQLKSIKVVGFAFFYLAQPMSPTDSTVRGYFLRKTGAGLGDSNTVDKGAYAVKLVE